MIFFRVSACRIIRVSACRIHSSQRLPDPGVHDDDRLLAG
jgi:hypothetical protein